MKTKDVKFRAKTPIGKWVCGDLIHMKDSHHTLKIQQGCDYFSVLEDTISMYTGINDVHGNEIYEGDILSYYDVEDHGCYVTDDPYPIWQSENYCVLQHELVKWDDGGFFVNGIPISFLYIENPIGNRADFFQNMNVPDNETEAAIIEENTGASIKDILSYGVQISGNMWDNPEVYELTSE